MANTFTLQSTSYKGRHLKLTCTQTQDINTNTSTIEWTLESIGGNDTYYYTGPTTLTIDGVQVYYAKRIGENGFPGLKGSTGGSIIIAHNNDGSKDVTVSLSTAIFYRDLSVVSDTWGLDAIPRFATIISAPSAFNDEENPTITYSNPAGEAIESLMACISLDGQTDDIEYRPLDPLKTSYTFELTDEERAILRMATLQGAATRTVHFILTSSIGEASSAGGIISDFNVINADPELTKELEDAHETTKNLTGGGNKYIKGYSDLKITMAADAKKGATIESYTATLDGEIQTGREIVFTNIQSADLSIACKDSRGILVTQELDDDIQLIDYFKPTVGVKGSIEMDGEITARVNIVINGTFFNETFGAEDNDIDVFIKYTDVDNWASLKQDLSISGNGYSVEFSMEDLDYTQSFVYQVKVADKLDSTTTTSYTLRMVPVFDWGENDFNFNVPITINKTPLFDLIYPVGSIYMSANSIDPAAIFGGTWERIQDRFLLAANDTNVGKTGGQSTATLTEANLPSHSHEAMSEYTGGSLLLRGPSDSNHNIADVSLGNDNITKTTYEGSAWDNSISTSSEDSLPEQINIGGTVTTTIQPAGNEAPTPIDIMPSYLAVYMWRRTA